MKTRRQILTPAEATDRKRELVESGILFEEARGKGIFTGKIIITVVE